MAAKNSTRRGPSPALRTAKDQLEKARARARKLSKDLKASATTDMVLGGVSVLIGAAGGGALRGAVGDTVLATESFAGIPTDLSLGAGIALISGFMGWKYGVTAGAGMAAPWVSDSVNNAVVRMMTTNESAAPPAAAQVAAAS